jgi:hypothetical protein
MVEQCAAVFAKIGVEAAAKSIYQSRTRSKFKPVIGKARYGGSPYCAILDEAHRYRTISFTSRSERDATREKTVSC